MASKKEVEKETVKEKERPIIVKIEMPKEKQPLIEMGGKTSRGAFAQGGGWAFIGVIAGAIIGVLLSLFSIYNIGVQGLLGTLVLGLGCAIIFGIIGFFVGVIDYWLPPKLKSFFGIVMVVVIVGGLIYALWTMQQAGTLPEYLKFASPVFESIQKGVKEIGKFRYCLVADPKCPFFVPWDEPTIQSQQEELAVDVSFDEKNIKPDNTVNLLVELSVKNPELAELKIKPRCYFKSRDEKGRELKVEGMGTYSYGDEFRLPPTKSGEELHTQFYCYGEIPEAEGKNIYSEKVIIELERPVAVKTTWPVWIGSTPRKGIVKSEMAFNAPYIVSLASNNDMPFEEGRDYSFQIMMKRRAEDAKFKRLQSLTIMSPEALMADCGENFAAINSVLEIRDASYDTLKNISQYDADEDKFVFPCTLYVSKAPNEAVLAPMQLEAYYSVYSDYDTRIFKSP